MSPSIRFFVIYGIVSSIDSLLVVNERPDGINIYLLSYSIYVIK